MAIVLGSGKLENPRSLPNITDLEKQFNVGKEDIKDITLETIEQMESEGKLPALGPGTEAESAIAEKTSDLYKKKVDMNLNYIQDVTGLNISNEGLKLEDGWASFLLGRLDEYGARKKAFMDVFPNGEFIRVSVPEGPDKDKFYEVFKTDKSQKEYRLIDPVGIEFDWGDIEKFGSIANAQTFLEIIGALGDKKKLITGGIGQTLKNLLKTKTFKVFAGSLAGQQIDDWVNALSGYGEGQLSKEDIGTSEVIDNLSDINNFLEAGTSAAFYKVFDVLGSYFTKGERSGLIPEADDIARIAEKYGLDPLVTGQLLANPLIRKSWFQTKEFTRITEDVIEGQVQKLKSVLANLGKDGKEITYKDIIDIQNQAEQVYAQRIVNLLTSKSATKAEKERVLQDAIRDWNTISQKMVNTLTKDVAGSSADGGIKISGIQKSFAEEINSLLPKTKGKTVQQTLPDGTIKEKTLIVEGGDLFNSEVQKLQSLYKEFKKLNPTENFLNQKDAQKFINTLMGFRKQLFDLQFSPNQEVSKSATRLFNQIKNRFDPSNKANYSFGSDEFLEKLYMLDQQLVGNESVRGMKFIQEALTTKGGDIVGFADQFIKPGTFKIDALKNMLSESDAAAGGAMFNMVRDVWIKSLYRDPSKTASILKEWQAVDPQGLNQLLGGKVSVDELIEIGKIGNKTNNSLFQKMIDEQGTVKELIFETIEKSKGKKIGSSAAIDDLIMSSSGGDMNHPFMVSARAGIIEDILNKASKQTKTGPTTLDMNKLTKELDALKSNENLMKFFDNETIQMLEDMDKYVIQLAQGSDVGAVLSAGEKRQALIDGIFDPREWLNFGLTIFKNEILARVLSSRVTSSSLRGFTTDQMQSNPASAAKVILGEITSEFTEPDKKQEGPTVLEGTPISESESVSDLMENATAAAQVPVQIPQNTPAGSPISSTRVVAPLPTVQGAGINVAQRGQQAFPLDPIFTAAEGGLATLRGKQMVV